MLHDAPARSTPDVGTVTDLSRDGPAVAADVPRRFHGLIVDWRLIGVAVVIEVVAVFITFMVVHVPVGGPRLTRSEAVMHWHAAAISAAAVLVGVLFIVRATLQARRRGAALEARGIIAVAPAAAVDPPRVPWSLGLDVVGARAPRIAGALSLATILPSVIFGAPLWLAWLAILAPWVPLVVRETRAKAAISPLFACFGLLVLLQLLHMVEHSTQIGQLLVTGGDLSRSHGAIGQLDFELVHFVTDSALWVSIGLLTVIFKGRNTWLWIAFAATSLHQVEHFYLFWLDKVQHTVYLSGGVAGIMGKHGLIGSPLDRPYLHFTYNMIILVPLLIAFWDEARWMDRLRPGRDPARAPAAAS